MCIDSSGGGGIVVSGSYDSGGGISSKYIYRLIHFAQRHCMDVK